MNITETISKTYLSWGFGNNSTMLGVLIADRDKRLKPYWTCKIIASDPGQERDTTYKTTIPFYKEYFENRGIEVIIIDRGYDIYSHFWDRKQVPLGWANPYCSSHFKRDLINSYFSKKYGVNGRIYKKYNVKITELIGFTYDEIQRVKPAKPHWKNRKFPLVDLKISNKDTIDFFNNRKDLPKPGKSSCWFCPNKPIGYFRELKNNFPHKFEMLLELEDNAKKGYPDNPPTLKIQGSMRKIVQEQTSLDDYFGDSCSAYCMI